MDRARGRGAGGRCAPPDPLAVMTFRPAGSTGGKPPGPPVIAAYGTLGAPITSEAIGAGGVTVGGVRVGGEEGYWAERRPGGGGRRVVGLGGAGGGAGVVEPA